MTPEQLKASILQYAIQGKLVEQRPEEGTGEELYQQIQAEKQWLIKEGKIKKDKPLPDIAEDEKPFDIPESWKWVRIGALTYNWGQKTPDSRFCYIDVGSVNNTLHTLNKENTIVEAKDASSRAKKIVKKGDVIFATIRPYLKNICIIDKDFPCEPIASTAFAVMHCHEGLLNKYLYYYLLSPTFMRFANARDKAKGVAYPAIGEKDFFNGIIALPPIAEQHRIVAKIEELLPLVDRYAAAYEKLEQFNAKFPEDMKKSILQYAIQGKLVEQRAEEGTGEELYRQIQEEKKRLIKEGTIKKEKPLAEIAEDEIPFDIPESWKWVRLSQIAILENGDRSGKYPVEKDYVDFGVPFFGAKDMCDAVMSFDNVRYISMEKFAELGNGKLQDKDFICLLRGSVGKCALFVADEQHHTGFICAQMVIIRCINTALCHYMASFLASPFYLRYIDSKVTGTAVRQLPAKELGNVLIPLPPLAEQNRIVAKLEGILPLCEQLK